MSRNHNIISSIHFLNLLVYTALLIVIPFPHLSSARSKVNFVLSFCWSDSNLLGLMAVDLGHVGEQVEHAAGVAPFVVVPAHELDEVLVEGDTCLGIEDGAVGVAVHVGADNVVFGVRKDAYLEQSVSFCT